MDFQIKYGASANITTATPVQGCWYVTTDTHELYFCADGVTITKVNDVEPFDPTELNTSVDTLKTDITELKTGLDNLADKVYVSTSENLPDVGQENIVYIVEHENATYRWSEEDNRYYAIGRNYEDIQILHGGNAAG